MAKKNGHESDARTQLTKKAIENKKNALFEMERKKRALKAELKGIEQKIELIHLDFDTGTEDSQEPLPLDGESDRDQEGPRA